MIPFTTALFDFDGVVADTEPLYNEFWDAAAERYNLGIPHFALKIKGTVLAHILSTYFSNHTAQEVKQLINECDEFETNLSFPEIPGALSFIQALRDKGVKVGLVTSSTDRKMRMAFEQMQLQDLFDTVVTADRITEGKPDPMCYLLAATDLNVLPHECIVFEDSFAGIEAGKKAGMEVIGLSTTNPKEEILRIVDRELPNFVGIEPAILGF